MEMKKDTKKYGLPITGSKNDKRVNIETNITST